MPDGAIGLALVVLGMVDGHHVEIEGELIGALRNPERVVEGRMAAGFLISEEDAVRCAGPLAPVEPEQAIWWSKGAWLITISDGRGVSSLR